MVSAGIESAANLSVFVRTCQKVGSFASVV